MSLFSKRKRPTLEHPYFGSLRYMGDYWEGELVVPGLPEKLGLVIVASEEGPADAQVDFSRSLLADLDGLFVRCKPLFEGDFETWAGRPFPENWREEFALVGLDLPARGDDTEPWSAGYFVDAANHYFTAYFEGGRASYLTIDG